MDEVQLLKKRLERERLARKQAESILEKKALELFKLNEELEQKVVVRTTELRNSEEKYRGIIENMELGLLEVDNNQRIIKAYDWFCDMTGYSQEELIGKNAKKFLLIDDEGQKINKSQQEKREQGQAGVYELKIRHKKGHPIWVLISGSPIFDTEGNITGSLGIHYDITKRKELEQDLISAKKIAEDAQEAQKNFLAKMSHEIRTPLNAIIGMSHMLKDSQPNKNQLEYLSVLEQSSQMLKMLISDILDFSKIQSGEIKVRKGNFDLFQLINNLKKVIELKAITKNIVIKTEVDPRIKNTVNGDKLLLNQILINLLGNALKFTHKGEIAIQLDLLEEKNDIQTIQFKVIDTGIGIPKNKIDLIFKDFKQADDNIQHQYGGTGLGLSITKQLVEIQGGSIAVESVVNQGTAFSFDLKYSTVMEDPDQLPINQDDKQLISKFKDAELLIVEDNPMNQKYIGMLFNKWNINYEFANDGLEALEKAFVKAYDMIFMDITMPNMNGYEATKSIRAFDNPNQNTPIIALSALAIVEKKDEAFEAGMSDFLGKPFEPNGILTILNKYLNSSETVINQNNSELVFQYPAPLDNDHLQSLYFDDYEYAYEIFNIFLNTTVPAFSEIKISIEKRAFKHVQKQAHKLKPNFSMVGLLEIEAGLEKLESFSLQEDNKDEAQSLYKELEQTLNEALPVIKSTTNTLNNINKKTNSEI